MEMVKYNKSKPAMRAKNNNNNGDESSKARHQSMHAKFMNQGREAALHGDTVEAERFFQQAEHYLRIMNNAQERKAKVAASQPASVEQGANSSSGMGPEKESPMVKQENSSDKVDHPTTAKKPSARLAPEKPEKKESDVTVKRLARKNDGEQTRGTSQEAETEPALPRSGRPRRAASLSNKIPKAPITE